jgi:hypothetical protein
VFGLVHVADQCAALLRDRGFDVAVSRRGDGRYVVVVRHMKVPSNHVLQEFEITVARYGGALDGGSVGRR